jgi:hypothetical protein
VWVVSPTHRRLAVVSGESWMSPAARKAVVAAAASVPACPCCCTPMTLHAHTQVFLVVFCSRGLAEELVFRVMALPHPAVDGPTSPGDFAARCVWAGC